MRTFTGLATIVLIAAAGCRQSSERERAEPEAAQQKGTERTTEAEQPATGEPGMGEPGMGEPGMGEPGRTGAAEPGRTGAAEPGMGEPGMGEPGAAEQAKDILGMARGIGNLTTFVNAVEIAELGDTLSGPGPFTVFAPTDEAFAKIPKAKLDALLADKEQLRAILSYHVVPGKMVATDLVGGKMAELKTASGRELSVDTKEGVKVGDALVIMADIPASNGVIHEIDTVLIPEGMGPQARASSEPEQPGGM